jgi:hypothetical protein
MLTKFEQFALDEWLSEYPSNMSFQNVLDKIYEESEHVTVWSMIENRNALTIIQTIEDTKSHAERVFGVEV